MLLWKTYISILVYTVILSHIKLNLPAQH